MTDLSIRRLCVFCGSRHGIDAVFADAARDLGTEMARRGIELVYGGGNVGLMGVVADAILADGGRVTGVIPEALAAKELAHGDIQDLRVVGSMHERKALMAELADAFVAMPGGLGTLEEFFEVLTWGQLGFHHKPVALYNVDGYYDGLLSFVDHAVTRGFVRREHGRMVIAESSVDALLERLVRYRPPEVSKWLERESL